MASQIQDANEAALVEDMIRRGELSGSAAARAAADLKAFRDSAGPAPVAPNRAAEVAAAPAALPGNAPAENTDSLPWRATKDILDAGATVASGALGNIVGGALGAGNFIGGVASGKSGEKAVEDAEKLRSRVAEGMTWTPKTDDVVRAAVKAGELNAKYIEPVTDALDTAFYYAGFKNPEAATAIKTAVYGLPSIFGLKGMRLPARFVRNLETKPDKALMVRMAEQTANDKGLVLNNNEFADSAVKMADRMFPEGDLSDGQNALRTARADARKDVRAAYDEANRLGGQTAPDPFKDLHGDLRMEYATRNMDVQNMPKVKELLRDFKQIDRLRFDTLTRKLSKQKKSAIELRDLATMRERVSDAINSAEGSEKAALQIMKNKFDNTLDDVFNQGAISGDPGALDAWKNARSLHAQWKKNFDANRTVKKLLNEDATPEAMYRWVVGASARGAKKEAATVVASLKKALGDDHPVIGEMRKAVSRDILKPLFERDQPGWDATITSINKLLKENPSLVKELGINVDDMLAVRKAAHAAKSITVTPTNLITQPLLTKAAVRFMFGSGIAKAGAKVNILTKILDKLVDTGVLTKEQLLQKMADDEGMFSKMPPLRSSMGKELTVRRPGNLELLGGGALAGLSQDDNPNN